ncbi:MAG: hypothetical protein MR021_08690 [Clostridiales bacterium]|nr:hypothetical protein [Clostridiales bacterium]
MTNINGNVSLKNEYFGYCQIGKGSVEFAEKSVQILKQCGEAEIRSDGFLRLFLNGKEYAGNEKGDTR